MKRNFLRPRRFPAPATQVIPKDRRWGSPTNVARATDGSYPRGTHGKAVVSASRDLPSSASASSGQLGTLRPVRLRSRASRSEAPSLADPTAGGPRRVLHRLRTRAWSGFSPRAAAVGAHRTGSDHGVRDDAGCCQARAIAPPTFPAIDRGLAVKYQDEWERFELLQWVAAVRDRHLDLRSLDTEHQCAVLLTLCPGLKIPRRRWLFARRNVMHCLIATMRDLAQVSLLLACLLIVFGALQYVAFRAGPLGTQTRPPTGAGRNAAPAFTTTFASFSEGWSPP